jgi:hypothetical protein
MNRIFCFLILGLGGTALGQNVPYRHLGNPVTITNIEIVWAADTNHLPSQLWIYKALPATVSSDAISNLTDLGSFTGKDRKKISDNPHVISYADLAEKKSLLINTEWSFIHYSDPSANDMHNTNGVPDKQQAFEIATNWLDRLAVDSAQLSKDFRGNGLKVYGGAERVTFHPRGGGSPLPPIFPRMMSSSNARSTALKFQAGRRGAAVR